MQAVASNTSGQDDSPRRTSEHELQELQPISEEGKERQCEAHTLSLALEDRELWTRFQCITNEMIVTKNGRWVERKMTLCFFREVSPYYNIYARKA
jgi:hypothetical protein